MKQQKRSNSFSRFLHNHLATLGLIMLFLTILITLAAPLLPLPDPNTTKLEDRLKPIASPGHILGTDHLGRDILSRLVWGTRVSLVVGVVATALAAVVGSTIGIFAGYYGKWIDNILMRGVDMLMAFPYMLLALAIVAVLGPGLLNALLAISLVNIPFFARNVRGATVTLVRLEYVDAARLSGLSNLRILWGEMLPNVLPVIVITISTTVGWMILETAGLSFLGLGAQPPQADLGSMLGDGRKLILVAPHVATIPGLVILFVVIGINLVGDGLRDVLDPQLKSGALVSPAPATEVDKGVLRMLRAQGGGGAAVAGAMGTPQPGEDVPGIPVLDVNNLSTWFLIGKTPHKAVTNVSFDIKPGEALGIMGESGCGKSTLARMLVKLTSPTSGTIRFKGQDVTGLKERERRSFYRKVQFVFQDPLSSLNPRKTTRQILETPLRRILTMPSRQREDRLDELMDLVNLRPEFLAKHPHEFSGGQNQRVGIARALAAEPELLVLDEPVSALDVSIQSQILNLLKGLKQELSLTYVFISHDLAVVEKLCETVAVMYLGYIVEYGRRETLFAAPRHPYTHVLLASIPKAGQKSVAKVALEGELPNPSARPTGCPFQARCYRAQEICSREIPSLQDYSENHFVACHFADDPVPPPLDTEGVR